MKRESIKKIISRAGLITVGVFLLAFGAVFAQPNKQDENPKVKEQLEAAKAALEKKDFNLATAAYERAIEIDPFNYAAHSGLSQIPINQYMSQLIVDGAMITDEKAVKEIADRMKANQAKMVVRYKELEAKYPNKAVFKVILSSLNMYEPVQVKKYLEEAYRLEPSNLQVLNALAGFEVARGDTRKVVEYFNKISELKPDDENAAWGSAFYLADIDKKAYRKKSREFIKRFPKSERSSMTLYWLAENSEDEAERISYLEELKRDYPSDKFSWSSSGMGDLFSIYVMRAPDKALALAREMVNTVSSPSQKKEWQANLDFQSGINQAAALLRENKSKEALDILEKMKTPRSLRTVNPLDILTAKALDRTGQTAIAYQKLIDGAVLRPSLELLSEIKVLGKKLGKDEKQVDADLQAKVVSQSQPIKDFSLERYDSDKKVSLSDYRGKVVILNFWYPMCGPCHQEAPFLQKLKDKHKEDLIILSPNVHPKEDTLVLPYFQSTKFDFLPLKAPDIEEWAQKEYGARGFPTNYLIDRQGRKAFNLGVVYQARYEEVQLLIEMVLAQP